MTIDVFLRVTKVAARCLLHHDHLLWLSPSLLNYALHVGCSIGTASCHLLNIVADRVKWGLRASLRHYWWKSTVLSRVNIGWGRWVSLVVIQIQRLELSRFIRRVLSLAVAGRRMNDGKVWPHHFTLLSVGGRNLWILVQLASCGSTTRWNNLLQFYPSILAILLAY